MRHGSNTHRLWLYRIATLLATAILAHLLTVWAVPRLIMQVLMNGPMAQQMNMRNQAAFPPPVNAQSRTGLRRTLVGGGGFGSAGLRGSVARHAED